MQKRMLMWELAKTDTSWLLPGIIDKQSYQFQHTSRQQKNYDYACAIKHQLID